MGIFGRLCLSFVIIYLIFYVFIQGSGWVGFGGVACGFDVLFLGFSFASCYFMLYFATFCCLRFSSL